MLGVTQPAISHYLHSKRGKAVIHMLKEDPQVMSLVEKLADLMYRGGPPSEIQRLTCEICLRVRASGKLSSLRKATQST